MVSGSKIFAGTNSSGVFLSTDTGASWTAVNNGLTNQTNMSLFALGTNIFATTSGGLFLTTNNGNSWSAVNSAWGNTLVNTMIQDGGNLYVGSQNGIFLSTNLGISWVPKNIGLTNLDISSLTIIGSKFYAVTGAGVFLSTDNGNSWANVNLGIPLSRLFSTGGNLYAFSYYGIYISTDQGSTWTAIHNGLINPDVISFLVDGNILFAGTYGSGIFYNSIVLAGIKDESKSTTSFDLYPNPVAKENKFFTVSVTRPIKEAWVEVFNLTGKIISTETIHDASSIEIQLDKMMPGIYIVKVKDEDRLYSKKLIIY